MMRLLVMSFNVILVVSPVAISVSMFLEMLRLVVTFLVPVFVRVRLGAVNSVEDGMLVEVNGLDVMLVIVGVVQFMVSVVIGVVLDVVVGIVVGVEVGIVVVVMMVRVVTILIRSNLSGNLMVVIVMGRLVVRRLIMAINVMLFTAMVVGVMIILVGSFLSSNLVFIEMSGLVVGISPVVLWLVAMTMTVRVRLGAVNSTEDGVLMEVNGLDIMLVIVCMV